MRYAIVSLDAVDWWSDGHASLSDGHASLTDSLGCTEIDVDVLRSGLEEAEIPVPTTREAVCVPLSADGEIVAHERLSVPSNGVGYVPAGTSASLRGGGTWLIVSAGADASSDDVRVVDSTTVEFSPPPTSDIDIARLTTRLGCTGMKVNLRRLEPGEAVPYHTEGTQEELFVPLGGSGSVLLDGERHVMAAGSVCRVAPEVPRSVMNAGGEPRTWLMIGAPPTGDANGWDPGAEILDWPDSDEGKLLD